jgi:glutaredoxin
MFFIKKVLNIFFIVAIFIALIFGFKQSVNAQNIPLNIDFFYGKGCPHCVKEKEYLKSLKQIYNDQISLHEYEIYNDQKNANLFQEIINRFNIDVAGVPLLIIGDEYIVGYNDDSSTGQEIVAYIEKYLQNLPEKEKIKSTSNNNPSLFLDTHFLGNIDLKTLSLPLATILIAFVDGFNPCALWILIFLITMLINMKDKKKLYILGSTFIIVSGIIYFIFLMAWFNLFKFIGYVYWIKVVIGIVAIISGILHIKTSLFSKGACQATSQKQRQNIMSKIKKTIAEKSFLLSILGVVILAISVNLIEVVCSAGLPAIYTSLLSGVKLTNLEYYFYLSLYTLIFIIDDLFIFFIAIKTFEVTGITQKYSKWSGLIGGILILLIGIILIVKPELLMFG